MESIYQKQRSSGFFISPKRGITEWLLKPELCDLIWTCVLFLGKLFLSYEARLELCDDDIDNANDAKGITIAQLFSLRKTYTHRYFSDIKWFTGVTEEWSFWNQLSMACKKYWKLIIILTLSHM